MAGADAPDVGGAAAPVAAAAVLVLAAWLVPALGAPPSTAPAAHLTLSTVKFHIHTHQHRWMGQEQLMWAVLLLPLLLCWC